MKKIEVVRNVLEQIQDAIHTLIDNIVDRLGVVIKCRHRRRNNSTQFNSLGDQAGVTQVQRCFPQNQDQAPLIL